MPMPDPRGPIRTITKVEPASLAHPSCALVTLSCGHVSELNPTFSYYPGERGHCLACLAEAEAKQPTA